MVSGASDTTGERHTEVAEDAGGASGQLGDVGIHALAHQPGERGHHVGAATATPRVVVVTPAHAVGQERTERVDVVRYERVGDPEGGPAIDPSAPQSLVYANTPKGAVLVAVMYIDSPLDTTTPDPGGCLTQWHVHTNLCFGRGGKGVIGEMDPTCPAGSVNRVSPPRLHVWFAPIPGGPTAVDAADAQAVHAAEQMASPHNATA